MKNLFSAANRYLEYCDWKDISLLKFCVAAFGALVGLAIPARKKKPAAWVAALVFVAAYIPLMMKFLPFLCTEGDCGDE